MRMVRWMEMQWDSLTVRQKGLLKERQRAKPMEPHTDS
jgi:hypothetical protein